MVSVTANLIQINRYAGGSGIGKCAISLIFLYVDNEGLLSLALRTQY